MRRAKKRNQQKKAPSLSGVDGRGWMTIMDTIDRPPGAFQKHIHINPFRVQQNWTVFACQTLIAGDIGKLSVGIFDKDDDGIFSEVDIPAFSPVLRKPNDYQTWQKFIEHWMLSKLSSGNTYALKHRDNRNVVVGMTILDPKRVEPLVAPDGSVFYQLKEDDLAQVPKDLPAIPAEEIMHDRMWCLYHPLVGLSPIFACGLAAIQGLEIQGNSATFFANASRPSGILVAPGRISDETAGRMKNEWETNYRGTEGAGKVAVLGDGLKYEQLTQNAVDSELVAQLNMTAAMICSAYHVPGYKIGVGPMPTYQNAEILNQIYYDTCLQTLIRSVQGQLDEGLGLREIPGRSLCVHLNLDDLLLMDSATQIETLNKSVGGGWMKPNEARKKRNMKPVKGGDTPYLQVQNYGLAALAERDANGPPVTPGLPAPTPDPNAAKSNVYALLARARKGLKNAA